MKCISESLWMLFTDTRTPSSNKSAGLKSRLNLFLISICLSLLINGKT